MLFNTFTFAYFFCLIFFVYIGLDKKRQNWLLLFAGYFFYAWWDWRFLGLVIFSTVMDFCFAILIDEASDERRRKLFLILSIVANLGILGFFKYFVFFTTAFGLELDPIFSEIILPIGISFYTFQSMSYTIDIYLREIKPTKSLLEFAVFVSFFPHLVAGPIMRAKALLPQIVAPRVMSWEKLHKGTFLILWGLYQKCVVADSLAWIVDPIFVKTGTYSGTQVLIGLYAFAFQIYCDFAGYSNLARGLAYYLGFELVVNFNVPYLATNPTEFWKRWHISLSTWLRDYLYIPLGGNRGGSLRTVRNLLITMLLGGLWHGAGWVFLIWGLYHGLLLAAYRLLGPIFRRMFSFKDSLVGTWIKTFIFFHLICLGWLFFRAPTLDRSWRMLTALWTNFADGESLAEVIIFIGQFVPLTALLLIVEYVQYKKNDLLAVLSAPLAIRVLLYIICYGLIMTYGLPAKRDFIYFQF
jgi:alginate O-acetyltransferase complex protein AlgI